MGIVGQCSRPSGGHVPKIFQKFCLYQRGSACQRTPVLRRDWPGAGHRTGIMLGENGRHRYGLLLSHTQNACARQCREARFRMHTLQFCNGHHNLLVLGPVRGGGGGEGYGESAPARLGHHIDLSTVCQAALPTGSSEVLDKGCWTPRCCVLRQ